MAKRASSKVKRKKRSVDQSAVKGGGIMSINKSNTSLGMKIILVILIFSFVMLFSYGGITGFIDLFKPQPKAAVVDPITAVKDRYDPQIAAFKQSLASSPTSYTALVNLGNTAFNYAVALEQMSSPTTASAILAAQQWTQARDSYGKAVKTKGKKLEPSVGVDYAASLYYSGDATSAVTMALKVTKVDPKFAPAYYNLGIFYQGQGNSALAVPAYQRYIVLDPKGTFGSPDYVIQQLKTLGGSVPSTATAAPSVPSSPTTP